MSLPLPQSDDESSTALDSTSPYGADPNNEAIELAAHYNGPCCEKCGAVFKSDLTSVCRKCGWYASLKQFVEVDHDWETYCDDDQPTAPAARPSHAAVWLELLPRWAWIVIATVSVVVIESVAARLLTSEGSSLRTAWSLTQLMVGAIAFAACHLVNFMFAVADDADTGALDMILRPLKLWFKAFANLPARLWVTDTAAAGLTATAMSIIVIGGLPYERLWDWGFEKPKNPNLLGAVMSRVQQVEGKGADNLEDAIGDFAGSQNLPAGDNKPAPPPKPRLKSDCVIVGYRVDAEGRLQSLILGTAFKKKLVYACSVPPQLSAEKAAELLQMLKETGSNQPYLPLQISFKSVRYGSCQNIPVASAMRARTTPADCLIPGGTISWAPWIEFAAG